MDQVDDVVDWRHGRVHGGPTEARGTQVLSVDGVTDGGRGG
jgi:hypothetical protein